jgi:hypothetical protein
MPAKGQTMSLEQRQLRSDLMRGERNHRWRGGHTTARGYVQLKRRGHPMAAPNGNILEHRLVLAQHIGRDLRASEQVHHVNEVRTDNRIENLWLFADRAAHAHWHVIARGGELQQAMAALPVGRR